MGVEIRNYVLICSSLGLYLPGHVMVGPLSVKTDFKPLPSDLEEFVSNSGGHGFIIVSFGTNVASLPQTKVDMLATAFGKLKQRVVWRLTGNIESHKK